MSYFSRVLKISPVMFGIFLGLIFSTAPLANAAASLPIQSVVKIFAGSIQSGSGILVDSSNNYILTNAHVVLDDHTHKPFSSYTVCTVLTDSDPTYCAFSAILLYADVDKDLALIKVNALREGITGALFDYHSFNIESAKNPSAGESITILGFPGLGGDTITISQGIASGFNLDSSGNIENIKTDSNIISGNSGGLAIDSSGNFVGIPSAHLSNFSDEKIGLIISGIQARDWYHQVIKEMAKDEFRAPVILTYYPGMIPAVQAQKSSSTSVLLKWDPPVSTNPIDHYDLTYDTKELFQEEVQNTEDVPNFTRLPDNKTSFIINNLEAGATYYFSVIAVNSDGYYGGYWSGPVTINLGSGQTGDRVFSDVPVDDENILAITYLKENGIVNGYPDSTYRAKKSIQRGELMKIVVLGQGINAEPEKYHDCFSDVKNEWFAPYVCYAKEKGWVKGYEGNMFRPGQDVSYTEGLKIIAKAYNMPVEKAFMSTSFPVSMKDQWYTPYLAFAQDFFILPEKLSSLNVAEKISRGKTSELLYRTILLWNNRDKYSTEIWKDVDGKEVDVKSYYGLRDITKKFKTTNPDIVNDQGITYEDVLKKGCTISKDAECYKHTFDGGESEIEYLDNGIKVLNGTIKIFNNPLVYVDPAFTLPNRNTVNYFKLKTPVELSIGEVKVKIFDGTSTFEFLGNEKVNTPLGEKDALKIKEIASMIGQYTIEGNIHGTFSSTVESTQYFVKGIGKVKSSTITTTKIGSVVKTNKSNTVLLEVK